LSVELFYATDWSNLSFVKLGSCSSIASALEHTVHNHMEELLCLF